MNEETTKTEQKEAEKKFIILYRLCRLYKEEKLDDAAVIHFLAGFVDFIPKDGDFSKY